MPFKNSPIWSHCSFLHFCSEIALGRKRRQKTIGWGVVTGPAKDNFFVNVFERFEMEIKIYFAEVESRKRGRSLNENWTLRKFVFVKA